MHCQTYQRPRGGMATCILMVGLSNVPASLHGDRYWHPCAGMGTGIPAGGWVPASLQGGLSNLPAPLHRDKYQHPQANTSQLHAGPSLTVPSPATLLTHNPKAIRPGGKLKQGELNPRSACSQGTGMPTAPQQPPAEATGLVSPHAQLAPLGRCFWPLYRARKNLSMQRPSPTKHHVFL